jgi:hypothetical protein
MLHPYNARLRQRIGKSINRRRWFVGARFIAPFRNGQQIAPLWLEEMGQRILPLTISTTSLTPCGTAIL